MKNKIRIGGLNRFEIILWSASAVVIIASSLLSGHIDYFSVIGSLIGITSLIYLAKGYAVGQVLMIIFSLFYGTVSYFTQYYGEMITYLCMTMPMAVVALVQWLRNPYKDTKEVKVSKVSKKQAALMYFSAVCVTAAFYFVLKALGNASLIISTISITTSFIAAYLTALRSPYCTLCYGCNDVVLIALWTIASIKDPQNISMVACFATFLVNDLYGFYSWKKMEKRQNKNL